MGAASTDSNPESTASESAENPALTAYGLESE